jgi:transitional endoplasmic reticulum ATPase
MGKLNVLQTDYFFHVDQAKIHKVNQNLYEQAFHYQKAGEILEKMILFLTDQQEIEEKKKLANSYRTVSSKILEDIRSHPNKTNINQSTGEVIHSSSKWIPEKVSDVKFSDVIGLETIEDIIRVRIIYPIFHKEKYLEYGKKTGGGVLLYGPPGTGKTMIVRAIANEVKAAFYSVKGSDILSKWVGESEGNISSLFNEAKNHPLAIIFIDEMESMFKKRGSDNYNDQRVAEFLQHIDGFSGQNPNVLLIGATNRPSDVDYAVLRPGRFSEHIYIPLPNQNSRKKMFQLFLAKAPIENNLNFTQLAIETDQYSGADIAEVCDKAKEKPLLDYIKTNKKTLVTELDILAAIKKVPRSVTDEDIKYFTKYNETKISQ